MFALKYSEEFNNWSCGRYHFTYYITCFLNYFERSKMFSLVPIACNSLDTGPKLLTFAVSHNCLYLPRIFLLFFFFFFFFLRRHQFSWPYTAVGAKLPQKGAYKQSSANSVLWRLHWFWWLVLEHEHEPVWVHEGQSWQLLELCHQCKLRVPGSYFRHHF